MRKDENTNDNIADTSVWRLRCGKCVAFPKQCSTPAQDSAILGIEILNHGATHTSFYPSCQCDVDGVTWLHFKDHAKETEQLCKVNLFHGSHGYQNACVAANLQRLEARQEFRSCPSPRQDSNSMNFCKLSTNEADIRGVLFGYVSWNREFALRDAESDYPYECGNQVE